MHLLHYVFHNHVILLQLARYFLTQSQCVLKYRAVCFYCSLTSPLVFVHIVNWFSKKISINSWEER
nr:MAG TPA: hypothetical protein [Caudoviricetes sp.]